MITTKISAFIALSLLLIPSALSQVVESKFEPKQIRFVLGAAPGQDYDTWARLIGRHLGKQIASSPNVIVENMPGGGHIIATNWLYNVAPKDGTVWGMVSRNIPSQAFFKLPNVRFDPLKFIWIGSPELTNRGCFAMSNSGVTKAEHLFERELIVGGTGAGSAVSQTPVLLAGLLGMKFKIIEGYEKPQDAVRAMEGGELGGVCQTVQSFTRERRDLFKTGAVNTLFTLEREPVEGINAPTIYELVGTEEQKKILDLYSSSIELGRPMMLPPGVPTDRIIAIRQAFNNTINDPAFRTEAVRLGLSVKLRTGQELESLIRTLYDTPQEIVEKTAKLTGVRSGR